jgi:hypothetical protein
MAERITAKRCQKYLEYLGKLGKFPTSAAFNQKTHKYSRGFFYIDVAYGKPRLVFIYKGTGESDVSPRLPASQLHMWLQAAGVAGLKAR